MSFHIQTPGTPGIGAYLGQALGAGAQTFSEGLKESLGKKRENKALERLGGFEEGALKGLSPEYKKMLLNKVFAQPKETTAQKLDVKDVRNWRNDALNAIEQSDEMQSTGNHLEKLVEEASSLNDPSARSKLSAELQGSLPEQVEHALSIISKNSQISDRKFSYAAKKVGITGWEPTPVMKRKLAAQNVYRKAAKERADSLREFLEANENLLDENPKEAQKKIQEFRLQGNKVFNNAEKEANLILQGKKKPPKKEEETSEEEQLYESGGKVYKIVNGKPKQVTSL